MYVEIGAFDAKAQLSRLLQQIKRGKRYTITVRGRPVADLIPCAGSLHQDIDLAINAMQKIQKIREVPSDTIKTWLEEGRK